MRFGTESLAILAVLLLAAVVVVAEQTAKITLDNRTDVALNLYVDKNFACKAESKATCTTTVALGEHYFEARNLDDNGGASSTHTVTEDETWEVISE